jgi:hypothetical protein
MKKRKRDAILSLFPHVSVEERVREACSNSFRDWQTIVDEENRMIENSPLISFDILGTFVGRGFSQQLIISESGEKLQITFAGSTASTQPLRLIWLNKKTVKICSQPHLSPDLLDDGDWSELTFEVQIEGNKVMTLSRKSGTGIDVYERRLDTN